MGLRHTQAQTHAPQCGKRKVFTVKIICHDAGHGQGACAGEQNKTENLAPYLLSPFQIDNLWACMWTLHEFNAEQSSQEQGELAGTRVLCEAFAFAMLHSFGSMSVIELFWRFVCSSLKVSLCLFAVR